MQYYYLKIMYNYNEQLRLKIHLNLTKKNMHAQGSMRK